MNSNILELAKTILKSRDETEKLSLAVDLAYAVIEANFSAPQPRAPMSVSSSTTSSSKTLTCECGDELSKESWRYKTKAKHNKGTGHDFSSAHAKGMVLKGKWPVEKYFDHSGCRLSEASRREFLHEHSLVLRESSTPKAPTVRQILAEIEPTPPSPSVAQEEDEVTCPFCNEDVVESVYKSKEHMCSARRDYIKAKKLKAERHRMQEEQERMARVAQEEKAKSEDYDSGADIAPIPDPRK